MIEAMKQALEALEKARKAVSAEHVGLITEDAITALRQAIEQAEGQEPVEVTQTFHSNGKPKGYVLPTQPQRNHSR
jgi:hypothetical protein